MDTQHSLYEIGQLGQDAIELLRQLYPEDRVHVDGVDAGQEHIGPEQTASDARESFGMAASIEQGRGGTRGGDRHAGGAACPQRGEGDTILVVTRVVIPRGAGVWLAIRFGVELDTKSWPAERGG